MRLDLIVGRRLAFLFLLLCAACQPLPQPFQPEQKWVDGNPLLELDDTAGVFVGAIENASPAVSGALGSALVAALLDLDIPASVETANSRSYLLYGTAYPSETPDGVRLEWQVIGEDDVIVGSFEQQVAAAQWQSPSSAMVERLANDAAPRIEALVRDESDAPPPLPPVVVEPVAGAPGDGNEALTAAMRRALRRAEVDVVETLTEGALVVLGSIFRAPEGEGMERVEVTWSVIRPDGSEIGRIDQSNVVASGSLDGRWGHIATVIADGGAEGIIALLQSSRSPESP